MKKRLLIFVFIILIAAALGAQAEVRKITFEDLLKHEFFNEEEGVGPGQTVFQPMKCSTVFIWPGNVKPMTEEIKNKIKRMLPNNGFADNFTNYVDIESEVSVTWSKEKIRRITRIYVQKALMQHITDELAPGDKVDTLYWIFGPFSAFEQIIHCFMVAYGEVQ